MSLAVDDLPEPAARPLRGPQAYPFPDRPVLPWSYADRRLGRGSVLLAGHRATRRAPARHSAVGLVGSAAGSTSTARR